jgi:anaerobic magnesium-protoporphyrin IX monomethyl ester cyclase
MRLLVTHPYHLALDPREDALSKPYPPVGTLQAAAVAQQAGAEVVFYDAMFAADEAAFAAVLDAHEVDAVLIIADDHSVQIKQCLARIRTATLTMTRMATEKGLPVFVSGPDVSDHPEVFLEAGAVAAVSGEVLGVLPEWIRGAADIVGLHGERGAGGRRGVLADLDALPDPAWSLCDLTPYAQRWRKHHGVWELNIWTARGCPYRCNWCAKPIWGRTYHVRSAKRVAAELHGLMAQHRPDRIWFTDDIFALRPSWLADFRAALGGKTLPYRCLSRVDLLVDPAYVDDLAATGCAGVWVGAESGSDAVLDAMDKDASVADIERARHLLRKHGIRTGFFLQLGYPGETVADVRSTVDLIRRLRPEEIGVSVSYPMPGTAFYEHVKGSMGSMNWETSMDNRTLYEAPYEQAFYIAAKELLRSTHSASRRRAVLKAFLQQPDSEHARKVLGAAWHSLRRPMVEAKMNRLAVENPQAVPLTW